MDWLQQSSAGEHTSQSSQPLLFLWPSSASSDHLVWPVLLLLFLLLLLRYARKLYLFTKQKRLPFPDIPYTVPNPHILLGHLPLLGADICQGQRRLCVDHASPDQATGVSTFFILNQTCFSCLNAQLMRRLLQFTQQRRGTSHQRRHTAQLFGATSILLQNGADWKASRQLIHKVLSTTHMAGRGGIQDKMQQSARRLETALVSRLMLPCIIRMDGLFLARLWSLQVFGDSVLGHNFGCVEAVHHNNDLTTMQDQVRTPTVLQQTAYLQTEFTRRLFHERFRPSAQWYQWPFDEANVKHKQAHQGLRDTLKGIVQERRKVMTKREEGKESESTSSSSSNLVDSLLLAQQQQSSSSSSPSKKDTNNHSPSFLKNNDDNDDAMADWLVTLLFGGYDTTSLAFTFTMYLLALFPEYQDKCAREARIVLGPESCSKKTNDNRLSSSSSSSFDASRDLPMINACLQESLRLYPPATITARNLDRPFSFEMPIDEEKEEGNDSGSNTKATPSATLRTKQVTLPKDTRILCSFYWIQRDPRNFERPNDFCPERWVQPRKHNADDDETATASPWEARTPDQDRSRESKDSIISVGNPQNVLAFSAGARNCVGQTLAQRMLPLMLAHLLRQVRLELQDPCTYEMVLERYGGNACPKHGLPLLLRKRETN